MELEIGRKYPLSVSNNGVDKNLFDIKIADITGEGENTRILGYVTWYNSDKCPKGIFGNVKVVGLDGVFLSSERMINVPDSDFNIVMKILRTSDDVELYSGNVRTGLGEYNSVKDDKAYTNWIKFCEMCYGKKSKGFTLCDEWKNFQNFTKWYYETMKVYESNDNFGRVELYLNIDTNNSLIISDVTVIPIEKEIKGFMKKYTYVIENDDVYTWKPGLRYNKNIDENKYEVKYYDYKKNKIVVIGVYDSIDDARMVYLKHLNNIKNNIIQYLKNKNDSRYEEIIQKCKEL